MLTRPMDTHSLCRLKEELGQLNATTSLLQSDLQIPDADLQRRLPEDEADGVAHHGALG